jgi:hypothetical protein
VPHTSSHNASLSAATAGVSKQGKASSTDTPQTAAPVPHEADSSVHTKEEEEEEEEAEDADDEIVDELDLYCQTSELCPSHNVATAAMRAGRLFTTTNTVTEILAVKAPTPTGASRSAASSLSSSRSPFDDSQQKATQLQFSDVVRSSSSGKLPTRLAEAPAARATSQPLMEGDIHQNAVRRAAEHPATPLDETADAGSSGKQHSAAARDESVSDNVRDNGVCITTDDFSARANAVDARGELCGCRAACTIKDSPCPAHTVSGERVVDSPYTPSLTPEFDGELLQLIRNYYLGKHTAATAKAEWRHVADASALAAHDDLTSSDGVLPPIQRRNRGSYGDHHREAVEQLSTLSAAQSPPAAVTSTSLSTRPQQRGSSSHAASLTDDHPGPTLDRAGNVKRSNNNYISNEGPNGLAGNLLAPQSSSVAGPEPRWATTTNVNGPDTYVRSPPLHSQAPPLPSPSSAPLHVDRRALNVFASPSVYATSPATVGSHAHLSTSSGDVVGGDAVNYVSLLRGGPYGLDTWQGGRDTTTYVSVAAMSSPGHRAAMPAPTSLPFSMAAEELRRRSTHNSSINTGDRVNGSGTTFPYSTTPSTALSATSAPLAAAAGVAASARGPGTSSSGVSGGIVGGLSALSSLPSYSSTSFVRAYVSDISLNLEPAIIVSALTAALNIVVVAFLQHHVLDTRDHLGLFLIGSYMIFASYYMIYYFLERFSSSFRRIASQDKKFYIIGNLIKAGILISITPFACVHLVKIIVFDEWESNILRNLGCIYAIPDFISMVVVRRMRWSTWVHHACVVLFNYFSIMNNYQHENVCRCVVVYAAFSSFAYCVNVLLASRFLGVSVNVARVLSFVALVVYALCCAVNWAWQVYYLRRLLTTGHEHWTVYMYMFLISLVMWDDIVLNKWLLHHARNNAFAASQHLQHHRMRQHQQNHQHQSQQRPSPLFAAQPRPAYLFRNPDERQAVSLETRPSPRAL